MAFNSIITCRLFRKLFNFCNCMTNLNQLIEQRQGEAKERILSTMDDGTIQYCPRDLESVITQTATESYRQALLDVDEKLEEQIEHALKMSNWQAQSALETIRAQIEGLLSKIDKV
jgi:hypothetical protein